MKRLVWFTWLLPLVSLAAANAAENPGTNAGSSSALKDAAAWNIRIERRFEFPAAIGDTAIRYGAPTFSHDFRRVLYVVGEPFRDPSAFNPYNNTALHSFLVVRSLESTEILKKIPLDGSFRSMAGTATVAYSPDEKKAVLGPVSFQDEKSGLLFIDLESSKITPVPIDFREHVARITWPEATYVSLSSKVALNRA